MGKIILKKNKHKVQEIREVPKESRLLSESEVFEAIDSFKNTKLYEDVNAYITKMKYSKDVTPYVNLDKTPENTIEEILNTIDEDAKKPLVKRRFFIASFETTPNKRVDYIVNVQKLLMYYILCGMYIREVAPTLVNNIVNKFKVKYTFAIQTMATNGPDIIINPGFLCYVHQRVGLVGVVGIIIHEGFHVLMNHFQRRERRIEEFQDFNRCNIAMDHEINLLINNNYGSVRFEKTIKTIGGCYNPKFEGMMWEDIYPLVSDKDPQGNGEEDKSSEGQEAEKQQSSSTGQSSSPSGGGSNTDNTPKSPDYIEGWNAAMNDYKENRLNI